MKRIWKKMGREKNIKNNVIERIRMLKENVKREY